VAARGRSLSSSDFAPVPPPGELDETYVPFLTAVCYWPAYTYCRARARLVTVVGAYRRLSSVVVVCNAAHMQRNSPGAARGGPVVLRPFRATLCFKRRRRISTHRPISLLQMQHKRFKMLWSIKCRQFHVHNTCAWSLHVFIIHYSFNYAHAQQRAFHLWFDSNWLLNSVRHFVFSLLHAAK